MIDLVSSEVSLSSGGEVDATMGVCAGGVSAAPPLPALTAPAVPTQLELRVVPSVQPMMQPPALQPGPPSSLQRLRHASDAAEGPWERPRAISTPNVHVLLVGALQGKEDLQLNQIVQLSILGTNSLPPC